MQQNFFPATQGEFERIFEIMDVSFPDNEMRTKEKQQQLFSENPHYHIFCLRNDKLAVAAFIIVWELDSFIFIENFAVDESTRGQGLGGELLDAVIAQYQKTVVLEVEPPEDEMKRRRIGFYERHGFTYHEFDYLMPPLREGDGFLPLKIMSHGKRFDKESFQNYQAEIYKIVYER